MNESAPVQALRTEMFRLMKLESQLDTEIRFPTVEGEAYLAHLREHLRQTDGDIKAFQKAINLLRDAEGLGL